MASCLGEWDGICLKVFGADGFSNQQFTSTNLTINNACTGVYMNWDWLWSFKSLIINNCQIGIDMSQQSLPALGSAMLADSVFNNVNQAIVTSFNCTAQSKPASAGTLVISNVDFTGAKIAISYPNGTVILRGGSVVPFWMQGHTYSAYYGPQVFPNHGNETCYIPKAQQVCVQGAFDPPPISASLKAPGGQIFDRGKPNYDNYPLSAFISTKANGCAGNGVADDTQCLINIFNKVSTSPIVYIDHGAYRVTSPIQIPNNIKIMGEGWPLIMINDQYGHWSDINNPIPAIKVGNPGDTGNVEIQDVLFETMGPTPGAILMQWNLAETTQGAAGKTCLHFVQRVLINNHIGLWDVHWRIGGTAGTLLQEDRCAKNPKVVIDTPDPTCIASFLLLHITSTASGYFENNWGWVSDHELDQASHGQINIFNGRGLLVESTSAVWVVGGSFEHSMLYNYGISNAQNVYMSHIQSETA